MTPRPRRPNRPGPDGAGEDRRVSGGYGNHPERQGGRPDEGSLGGVPVVRRGAPPDERAEDDAAAFVLGALSTEERAAASRRMRADAAFRREVAELDAIVGLLPRVLLLDDADRLPSVAGPVGSDLAPSPDLRARILAGVAAEARSPVARTAPNPGARSPRPAPSVRAAGPPTASGGGQGTLPSSRAPRGGQPPAVGHGRFDPRRGANRWMTGILAAVILVLAVAAIALQVRNTDLSDRVDTLAAQVTQTSRESEALRNEVALVGSQSNASSWVLNPNTAAGDAVPADATGTVFYSYREESVAAEIRGLPAPAAGQAYQLWYLGVDGSEAPRSAGVMTYTADGIAFFATSGVVRDFQQFAVSLEPAAGSEQPTTTPILIGTLSAAG